MWDSDTWQSCDEEGGSRFVDGFRCVALMAHSGAVEAHVGSIGPIMKLADVDLSLRVHQPHPEPEGCQDSKVKTLDF